MVDRDRNRVFDVAHAAAMRDVLEHRGPDDAGLFVAPGVVLGSRRLSILDLSAQGHMPMRSADGRYCIAYNGEIYNHLELREQLIGRGYTFKSRCDTETLLYLYQEFGPDMLQRLNGMFAAAIWDSERRELFLVRDRMGVKPLYYATVGDTLSFASEEKALFAGGVEPRFDEETWAEILCFRYVAGERTPFKGVKRLLPGHFLLWRDGEIQTRRWWRLDERVKAGQESAPANPDGWFRTMFDEAIGARRISDVPIGVLLSGGLDSSSVAASLANQAGKGVASFTVRFKDPDYDEGPLAAQVADKWGLEHHELCVDEEHLLGLLSRASWLNDEPLAHGNDLHLLAISDYARPRVTVLLSGEGADETLGGYVRYQPLRFASALMAARGPVALASRFGAPDRIRKLHRLLGLGSPRNFALYNASEVLPGDLTHLGLTGTPQFGFRESVMDEAAALYPRDLVRQAMYSDQHTFLCSILDRNDRMTMGASIECRVPFLDYRLVEGAGALPTSALFTGFKGKQPLRRGVGGRLPEDIRSHRKWGFAVPWNRYFRRHPALRRLVETLPEREPCQSSMFDPRKVREVVSQFLAGDDRWEHIIRQLVMVDVWYRGQWGADRQRQGVA
jgi:asparagine synthase (glutamine-hydrolysing)